MMNNLKIAAVGGVAALGLASAAIAQQSSEQKPNMPADQHQKMMSGGMQNSGMMQMMQACNKMMQQMGNMPHTNSTPRS